MSTVQFLQLADDGRCSHSVDVAEGSTAKRRKPDSEDGADVSVTDIAQNSFLKAARRLVDHREHATPYHLLVGNPYMLSRARARPGADDLINRLVDVALLPGSVLLVKAISSLATQATGANNTAHRFGGRHAQAERIGENNADLATDVDPHFIEEGDRTDGEPEVDERFVDEVDRGALIEQSPGLVHVRRQRPRRIKAGSVVDDDHRLAELLAVRDRGRRCLFRRT